MNMDRDATHEIKTAECSNPTVGKKGRLSNLRLLMKKGGRHKQDITHWLSEHLKKRVLSPNLSPEGTSSNRKKLFSEVVENRSEMTSTAGQEDMMELLKELRELRKENRENKLELMEKMEIQYTELKSQLEKQERRLN